ncbi:hypothetical protein M9H77_21498 [Catharanthus roseus]|uniref:Uncharacterized protein n=1 Tax=Catharanthus roseus TaxID=4058 RepID=A0ACC0AP74_CATRO|nr:hypothetical protein M9H77_21498 [Catharanthus roseus]
MEEVPAHVHPGPIVTDVLSRQHKHISSLIWSGDWETCYTDLQCRRFGRNLFQCYSAAPRRLVKIIDGTGVSLYIGNPANRDTRAHGYQPAGVDRQIITSMLQEVDDMQTIIRRCMVFIGGTLGCTPSQHDIQTTFPVQPSCRHPREHVPDQGASGVKRGARRHPGRGADMPSHSLGLTPDLESLPSGSGTSQMPLAPSSGFTAFQSPHPSTYGIGRFRAPPPPGTTGASTPHQLISQVSSSDEEEGQDALSRRHRVGKKIIRFTLSDWP